MRIMVTGHSGYIGAVMVKTLRAADHAVVGLDTGYFCEGGLPTPLEPIPALLKDVRDVVADDLFGFDAVVHLAALCNDPLGDVDPELTAEINHRATVRLATLARDAGVRRFIFASSCSMYGSGGGDEMLTEEAPLRPITPYAVSKVRAEEELSRLAGADFSPVYLRNATAYGVSPRLRGDVVLNNLVGWASTTARIRLMSDGRAWRPIVHVEDIAQACLACLEAPRAAVHDQALNIGNNRENYRIRELADIVRQTIPGSVVEYSGERGADCRNYRVDFSKASRILPDFKPRWTARSGAYQLWQAFKQYRIERDQFLGPQFNRLAQIRSLRAAAAIGADLRWTRAEVA